MACTGRADRTESRFRPEADIRASALPHGVEQQLPVAHVDPSVLFEPNTLEMRHLLEAHALVQRDAGIVRKRDPADDGNTSASGRERTLAAAELRSRQVESEN